MITERVFFRDINTFFVSDSFMSVKLVMNIIHANEKGLSRLEQLMHFLFFSFCAVFILNLDILDIFDTLILFEASFPELCNGHLRVNEEPHLADRGHPDQNSGVIDQILSLD